jgi:ABC-type lipoprotein release transport system permease subunit
VFGFHPLPWEYGVRNLFRRPGRSLLTLGGLTLAVLLIFMIAAFVRGLESSLAVSGDPHVVIVHTLGAAEFLENSSIPGRTSELVTASVEGVLHRYGQVYASPELYLGTQVGSKDAAAKAMGIVRGVTQSALMVRRNLQLLEGRWPGPDEVAIGRLGAAKLGLSAEQVALGQSLTFEGRSWVISGRFAATGSTLESELWCRLEDLQQAMKRQDLSLVALMLAPGANVGDVQEWCKERLDLELEATPETAYYASLQRHYAPVRLLAWIVALLVASAGVFAALNAMNGAVVGRVRELATLQPVGYTRGAIALVIVHEAELLAAAACLLASALALALVNGAAIRFTMGAFFLRVDATAMAIGCGTGFIVGLLGALFPAARAMRLPVSEALKAI